MEKKPSKKLEGKIEARVALDGKTKDLKNFFDLAASISKTPYPKSSTDDGSGEVKKVLSSGKELFYSLQDRKFPELFGELAKSRYFENKMTSYFNNYVDGISYKDFLNFCDRAYNPEKYSDKINPNIKDKSIDAMFKFCADSREEIIPNFVFSDTATELDKQFKSSDLIINLINNLIMRGQNL